MKIGIIGAGITGLSAAYQLSKAGHEVIVFEQSDTLGGLGTYLPIRKTHLERYYHHFFQTDKHLRFLSKELGLQKKLIYYQAKTGIYSDGKIYPFSSLQDLLRFTPLSLIDRFRCGMMVGFLKCMPVPLSFLDRLSAESFVKKYAGNAIYQIIWGPLLSGKFSQFAKDIPALWLWGRIYDRSFKLGYFDGSVKVLFDRMIAVITERKGEIRLRSKISGIKVLNESVVIHERGKKYFFDKVIITAVSPTALRLVQNQISSRYKKMLSSIDHLGAVCLILELDRPIQSQYWLNICDSDSPVLVMVEHTNMIPSRLYGGMHIVYLANYLHRNDPRFLLSDKEIYDSYTSILKRINKDFKKSWVKKWHVSRVPRAQTIFKLNAYQQIPLIQTELHNVYMVNIDQMYPHDRNINQGIALGEKVAKMILSNR
jgi:protoporphyrinogen oxidase